jgi:hypothetical protein
VDEFLQEGARCAKVDGYCGKEWERGESKLKREIGLKVQVDEEADLE